MPKSLAIVGGGAKAAAIVARASVLREIDPDNAPVVHVFEEDHIGAAWSGDGDYSSGFLKLCTAGEKDVGFPYADKGHRASSGLIAERLFERFSFSRFLVVTGLYRTWVERGRVYPSHHLFHEYLQWVFEVANHKEIEASVTSVVRKGRRWQVHYVEQMAPKSLTVDGVVLTGTGKAQGVNHAPNINQDRMLDARSFWSKRAEVLQNLTLARVDKAETPAIAVAGAGGAAGAIVAWLAEALAERKVPIYSISSMGTLFPRGDGYAERRWFSNPEGWQDLKEEHRREILRRTEAGVISQRNKSVIDLSEDVNYLPGHVTDAAKLRSGLLLERTYDEKTEFLAVDYLVCAIGFDPWSCLDLVQHKKAAALRAASKKRREAVELAFKEDLSFPAIAGMGQGLHAPGLAGMAQGPGMGNLGCLGLMAEAVLQPYLVDNFFVWRG